MSIALTHMGSCSSQRPPGLPHIQAGRGARCEWGGAGAGEDNLDQAGEEEAPERALHTTCLFTRSSEKSTAEPLL